MYEAQKHANDRELGLLLAGASKLVKSVQNCWLLTQSDAVGINARPMGRVLPEDEEGDWRIRFLTDSRSRKSLEVRMAHKVGLVFQNDSDEAFASFSGTATLIDESARVTQLWKAAYDAYFPTDMERAAAAFIEVRVEGMKLWIRGVTPEPFGLQPTILERTTKGQWYLKPVS